MYIAVRSTPRRCEACRLQARATSSDVRVYLPHSLRSPYMHHFPPSRLPASLTRCPTLEAILRPSELRTASTRTPSKRPDSDKYLKNNVPSFPLALHCPFARARFCAIWDGDAQTYAALIAFVHTLVLFLLLYWRTRAQTQLTPHFCAKQTIHLSSSIDVSQTFPSPLTPLH